MDAKKIGAEIKKYFEEQGITQESVARKTNVSRAYVNALLNGKGFGKKTAQTWSNLLGLSTTWLLTGEGEMFVTPTEEHPNTGNVVSTGDINGDHNTVAGGDVVNGVPADGEVIEAEVVELPIVPTAVVRQPEVRLSKWIDKYSDEVERLRLSEILRTASMVREVKDRDMAPSLKVGQYIYLELMPKDMPIKNGRIYFVDHKKVEGFFRRLYDRGDSIECRADKPAIEPNTYPKEDIFDIYKVVGVFSTDIIDDEEGLAKDLQIASLTEQLNRLMTQQDTHIKNTTEALAGTNKVIEQQGVLIDLLKKN